MSILKRSLERFLTVKNRCLIPHKKIKRSYRCRFKKKKENVQEK